MAIQNFICPTINATNVNVTNVVRTKQVYTTHVTSGAWAGYSQIWKVVFIHDDDTYVINPAPEGIIANWDTSCVAMKVQGPAVQQFQNGDYAYFMIFRANGNNNNVEVVDSRNLSGTVNYHLDLTADTQINFYYVESPTYTVNILDNGNGGTFPSAWNITLNKKDGTTITPTAFGSYSGIVSIQVDGQAYVHLTESQTRWYTITSVVGGTLYFNGQTSPSTTQYNLSLTQNVNIVLVYNVTNQEDPGGCFSANMVVRMADGTDKPIGELQPGDIIRNYNCVRGSDVEELVDSPVQFSSYGLRRTSPSYEKYTFSNGTVIEIVNRDRLYNVEENKMKWMDEWYIGEHGLTYDGQEVALVSHETINEPIEYHDFICDYHNYFINGMLAGQKKARWPFLPSRFHPNN